jgi:glycosyltransferase involved in cell wall biosynthesis/GT2 family glycosyltransferase
MPPTPEKEPGQALPSISVVICAFTLERLEVLGEAIGSILAQTTPAREVVVVIDHNPEMLEESRARWPAATVLANRETQGLSGARNTGVEESSGEVVAFLDDDAVAAADWLQRLEAAYDDPRVVGVGGTVRPLWAKARPRWFPDEFAWVVGCTHSGMPVEPASVRNLVGANMSFRRDALIEVGGFRHELGRVGTIPDGCEETDLCIRINERRSDASILFDPAATVDHLVPPARSRLSYFTERCAAEGRSKAVLTRLVGSQSGLASERSYVRRTLPLGFLAGLRDFLRGDLGGAERAAMLVVGLATTTLGYVSERGLLTGAGAGPGLADSAPNGDRLRLLMVTPRNPLGQGGVERHVIEVSRRVAAAGAVVEVLCAEPGAKAVSEEVRDGVRIRSVPAWPKNHDYYLAPRIWGEMSRRGWDVVHIQSYHTFVAPLAMLRALRLGIPYVVTFHGGGHSSGLRNRLRRVQRRALRPLLARAERLIAVARFEIDAYSRELHLPAEKFVLIPNGTDLARGNPDGTSRAGEPGLLASIGRLERYKGHHRVIAAMPGVLERRPEARLLVVGSGPYEADLRSLVAELGIEGSVDFTAIPADDRNGMSDLLDRVSLVVLMSDFETHPLVALEAAAAGRPLLVANNSGLAELAAEGAARAVAPDGDPAALAEAIFEELENPQPRQMPRLTSWDECAAELTELYAFLA